MIILGLLLQRAYCRITCRLSQLGIASCQGFGSAGFDFVAHLQGLGGQRRVFVHGRRQGAGRLG